MNITIQNEFASVTCRTLGAELLSYKTAAGKEYMWQKDPAFWGKTSPVLFPIVGNLRNDTVTFDGKPYTMAKHGLCRAAEFTIENVSDTDASFSYSYNEETLAYYP